MPPKSILGRRLLHFWTASTLDLLLIRESQGTLFSLLISPHPLVC